LISGLDNTVVTGNADINIEQIEYDSRLVKPGTLFIAVKGFQQDGFDFVDKARDNGAVAVLSERDSCFEIEAHVQVPDCRIAMAQVAAELYGHPGEKIKACGVTGTNGKTTTCYLLKNILVACNKTTGLITSQVYDTGKEKFKAERTTPESLDIQKLLFLMKGNFCVNVVIEVSSHALTLHRVDNINFRVGIFTNLTRDHLDYHKTMEEYFQAKALLAKRLDGPLSYAVVNLDVEQFQPLLTDLNCSYMTYALENEKADVCCGAYEFNPESTTFDLVTPMGTRTVSFNLPGRFNLENGLAAAAGGLASGVDLDNVVKGLEQSLPIPGRLNLIDVGQPFAVYIDYAHTPDALQRLGETVREITEGDLHLLFGCGGDRDKGKRPLMGEAAINVANRVVITSDNPRSENMEAIIEDIKPGLSGDNYEIISDRIEAIAAIINKARPGDAVLLAGKGAEPYQEINGKRTPFNDEDEAKKVLATLGYSRSGEVRES